MFCLEGKALLHRFEAAAVKRAVARDDVLRAHEPTTRCEERLYKAKRVYGEAFVAWVTHRSNCVDCRAASSSHDLTQFASV